MTKKCSQREFTIGCYEEYVAKNALNKSWGRVSVSREHGAYHARGFDRYGRHVNRGFRTAMAARKFAARAARHGDVERY